MFVRIMRMFHSQSDPIKHCTKYRNEGCAHVDGMLCDMLICSILKDYNERKQNETTIHIRLRRDTCS